jgi:hypothetical protein
MSTRHGRLVHVTHFFAHLGSFLSSADLPRTFSTWSRILFFRARGVSRDKMTAVVRGSHLMSF